MLPTRILRFGSAAACGLWLTASALAQTSSISAAALQQIQAVLADKAAHGAPLQKVDSVLIYTAMAVRGQSVPGVPQDAVSVSPLDLGQRASVDIRGTVSASLLSAIQSLGGTVVNTFPQYSSIRVDVPILQVQNLASRADVRSISAAEGFKLNRSGIPPAFIRGSAVRRALSRDQLFGILPVAPSLSSLLSRVGLAFIGSITSQGYVSHTANQVVTGRGISGIGVKVGVLSDSASPASVAALIASGDLPPDTVVLPGQAGTGTDEGTAMMEIVHDLAPGAKLYFATVDGGQANFANNINALRAAGCDIIVDDVTYFAEGAFQDGIPARAVNTVVGSGALYFSSAGNYGNLTDGRSGTWEGDFLDGGPVGAPIPEPARFHNFGTVGVPQNFNVQLAPSGIVSLYWSDPLGASTNDYDLFILNGTGTTLKGFSVGAQTGTQDPYEQVFQGSGCGTATPSGYCPAPGDRIVVVLFSGAPRALRVATFEGHSLHRYRRFHASHNAAANAISVAATYWNSAHTGTRPFTGFANPVEPFSSDGPRKMFYNPDGTPVTPGNVLFATNGGTTLAKPDVTAADGVFCKTPGFLPFFGTSAAAPHAAAVGALVKSANPILTNTQILNILLGTALDNMAAGVDRNGGHGIVMALPAVQAATH